MKVQFSEMEYHKPIRLETVHDQRGRQSAKINFTNQFRIDPLTALRLVFTLVS